MVVYNDATALAGYATMMMMVIPAKQN